MKLEDNVAVGITAHLNSLQENFGNNVLEEMIRFRAILLVIYQQKQKKNLLIYQKIVHLDEILTAVK